MAQDRSNNHLLVGISLAVLTTIIWSGNYVVARGIATKIPPVSLAFYRWGLASLCIIPIAWRKFQQEKQIIFENRNYIFWTALTGVTIFNTFIYLAGHYTSAINLALIGTTAAPVFATFFAAIFLKEYISIFRILGMILCITGILFLLSQGSWEKLLALHFAKGDALILISAFSFAIYSTLVRKKPIGISPTTFLFATFITGTLLLLPFYIWEIMHEAPVQWNGSMMSAILYLGIGNSVIGFLCWNGAISKMGAARTVIFANLIPVFSIAEAVFFLDESFLRIHLIGGMIVIGGLVLANIQTKKRES